MNKQGLVFSQMVCHCPVSNLDEYKRADSTGETAITSWLHEEGPPPDEF